MDSFNLSTFTSLIQDKPEQLATANKDIYNAALRSTKHIFDAALRLEEDSIPYISKLVASLNSSPAPQTRSQTNGKRKRSPSPIPLVFTPTPLPSLLVEGLDEDQIWAQLELRTKTICDMLDNVLEEDGDMPESTDDMSMDEEDNSEDFDGIDGLEEASDMEYDEIGSEEDSHDDDEAMDNGGEPIRKTEGVMGLRDSSSDESDNENDLLESRRGSGSRAAFHSHMQYSSAVSVLSDGFFDLASFNAEAEAAEAASSSAGHLAADDESDDDASIDLFATVDDHAEPGEDVDAHINELYYQDFFEPPPRVKRRRSPPTQSATSSRVRFHDEVKVRTIKAKGKNLPVSLLKGGVIVDGDDDDDGDHLSPFSFDDDDEDDEESFGNKDDASDGSSANEDELSSLDDGDISVDDERQAIERMKDDLFADDDAPVDTNISTHEKRLALLKKQIAELEAENIGPKDWVLMGEATSRARPQNSLLEEDLDFERVKKPVPIITQEVVRSLEETIKVRILEGRFDDVVRIRSTEDKPFLPSRLVELKDTKSTQSLAQIYENEYVAAQGGEAVDDRDGKLKKEHEDIEKQWESICNKLDALCNAHFTPKPPQSTISTVANVSSVTMESALPSLKSATSMLAPEELFATDTPIPRSRSEMTPAEKRAQRGKERKQKEKIRSSLSKVAGSQSSTRGISGVKKDKKKALDSLVKRGKGVTVVGKETKKKKKSKDDGR